MVRFWSVLPERRPVHLLEEPENGAELGGGAVIHHAAPTRPGVAWARSERARSSDVTYARCHYIDLILLAPPARST